MTEDRVRWDRRYHEEPTLAALEPNPFLVKNAHLLPPRGRALDVACGAGRNAVFLAERDLETVGIDISPVGLALAKKAAAARGVSLDLREADLTRDPLPRGFAVVACLHYLERRLFPELEAALDPDGLLFYETFTRGQLAFPEAHPRREEFLLAPNELLRAFANLDVLEYFEGAQRLADGRRAHVAQLVGRRRMREAGSHSATRH